MHTILIIKGSCNRMNKHIHGPLAIERVIRLGILGIRIADPFQAETLVYGL